MSKAGVSQIAQSAVSPNILPTHINWICYKGVILHYEHKTAAELISSGLLSPDEIPEIRAKQSRDGRLRVHIAKDGTYNVRLEAEDVMSRDKPFKKFLGGLLADTRLSLVKGEEA